MSLVNMANVQPCEQPQHGTYGGHIWPKVGHVGPKRDKSGTFSDQISVQARQAKMY